MLARSRTAGLLESAGLLISSDVLIACRLSGRSNKYVEIVRPEAAVISTPLIFLP